MALCDEVKYFLSVKVTYYRDVIIKSILWRKTL